MKIKDANPIYYANRKELVDQMRSLTKQKEEAEKKYSLTGESRFSEEAAGRSHEGIHRGYWQDHDGVPQAGEW